MNNARKYEITILMINYKPQIEKVFRTIRSLVFQQGVHFQIVIADDGSPENYFDEIRELFEELNFTDYVLVGNEKNQGTTLNFYSGLLKAEGTYLKGISPGDYLYSSDTLVKWLRFMKEGSYDCSFGKAVFYTRTDNRMSTYVRSYGYPVIPELYDPNNYKEKSIFLNCFILEDYILGASYFCKTELVLKYIKELLGKVKYLEDALYRNMLLNQIRTVYYPVNVVVYEYGTGVSTTANSVWKERVEADKAAINKIICSLNYDNNFYKKYCQFLLRSKKTSRFSKYLNILIKFPGAFAWKVYKKISMRSGKFKTPGDLDIDFMKTIGEENAGN